MFHLPPDNPFTGVVIFIAILSMMSAVFLLAVLVLKIYFYRRIAAAHRQIFVLLDVVKHWAQVGSDCRQDTQSMLRTVLNHVESAHVGREMTAINTQKLDEVKHAVEEVPTQVVQEIERKSGSGLHKKPTPPPPHDHKT